MSNQINKDTNTIEDWRKDTNRVSARVGLSSDQLYGKAFHNAAAFDSPDTGDNARIVKLDKDGTSISTGKFHLGYQTEGVPVPTILAQEYADDLFSITLTATLSSLGMLDWIATTSASDAGHKVYQGASLAAATWTATIISIQDVGTATPVITFGTPTGSTGVIDTSANIINNNLTETLAHANFSVTMTTKIPKAGNLKVFISNRGFDPDSPATTTPDDIYYGVWEEAVRPQSAQAWNGWYLVEGTDSPAGDDPIGSYSIRFVQDQLAYNKVKVIDSTISPALDGPYAKTAAEIAAGCVIVEWYEKPGTFERYGAVSWRDYSYPDSILLPDDTVAIQAAFNQNMELYGDPVRSGPGPYRITETVTWGTLSMSQKVWYAEGTTFWIYADITPITIGSITDSPGDDDGGVNEEFIIIGSFGATSYHETSTKPGVILGNIQQSDIRIHTIKNFHTGISWLPTHAFGRNNLYINHIESFSHYGIKLSPSGHARIRNNIIHGGEFSSSDDTCVSFIHIDDNDNSLSNVVGNAFIAPSFRSDATVAPANTIVDGGTHTMWVNPDFSRYAGDVPTNSFMKFTDESKWCQVTGGAKSWKGTLTIDDQGTNNTFFTDEMIQFNSKSFGVNASGAINTNQAAAVTTVGDQTHRMPIYSDDSPGTLIGYITIHAAS